MPNILTSWKEIGQYLGKGVRTVQRWEREAGLPVRRREGASRHAVLAIPEELNEWARSRTRGPAAPVAEILRRELAALQEQLLHLHRRVERIESNGHGNRTSGVNLTREATGTSENRLKKQGRRL